MRARALAVALLVAVLLVEGGVAFARPAESGAGAPSLDDLRARLDQLKREEADVKERARAEAAKTRAAIDERRAQRHALAEEVLTLELERRGLEARAAGLDREIAAARSRAADAAAATGAIVPEYVALAEQIEVLLGGMPGADELSARAARLRRSLGEKDARAAAAELLPALLADTLAAVSKVRVARTGVRLASGRIENAELLTAGNVAFAYRAGDRCGVALASPADASGFRWTESLEPHTRAEVAAALDAVASGAETCSVPMDPSAMLRVDDALHGWTLARIWEAGGPMMWPLAIVAVLALLLVCERVVYLGRQGGRAEKLLDHVLAACAGGDVTAARVECDRRRGLVARGLAACLEQVRGGAKAMENGFQEHLLHELPRLDRSMSQIGTLAAVAPLLGLLGTVTGIVQTFGVIRMFGNANPGLMAGGIAEALITTATGLVIAIPTLLAHNVLQARVDVLTGYAEQGAATVINRVARSNGT